MFARGTPAAKPKTDPVETAVHQMVQSARSESASATVELPEPAVTATAFGTGPDFKREVSQPRPRPQAEAPASGGIGLVQVAAGIFVALAVVGGGLILVGANDAPPPAEAAVADVPAEPQTAVAATAAPAPEPAPEVAATPEPEVQAETAAAPVAEPAPEPAPEPATEPETAAVADDPAPAEAAETAAAEADAATAPGLPAPTGTLRANQVAFAAWDVQMPFIENNRIVGNERVAVIQRILPTADLAEAGDWLAPGLLVYSVNGTDVQQSGSVVAAVLNALTVDPDGRARVVVQYAGSSLEPQTALLTVPTKRIVSLANGVSLSVSNVDGEWRTVVEGVTQPAATQLRQGDVLFRDKTSGTALDGPQSLEKILDGLVEGGISVTEFSIIRDKKLGSAAMQLATD
jgi:hypothetical protein